MRINNKGAARAVCFGVLLLLILSAGMPAYAKQREFYNYEGRYTLQLSDEEYSKISKVNNTLMSVRYGTAALLTINTANYYESLSEDERIGKQEHYTLGNEVFAETYNDETYMKEFFDSRLKHISGEKEILEITRVSVNSHEFWLCHFNLLGKKTVEVKPEGEGNAEGDVAESDATEGEASAEPSESDAPPASEEAAETEIVGEGKIYFTLNKGYSYTIQLTNKEGLLSDVPGMENVLSTIKLGLRQTKTFTIMWSGIGVVVLYMIYLIVRILTAGTTKKDPVLSQATKPIPLAVAIPPEIEAQCGNAYVEAKAKKLADELEHTKVYEPLPATSENLPPQEATPPAVAIAASPEPPAKKPIAAPKSPAAVTYNITVPDTEIITATVQTRMSTPPTRNAVLAFLSELPMLIVMFFVNLFSELSMKLMLAKERRAKRYVPMQQPQKSPTAVDYVAISSTGVISETESAGVPAAITIKLRRNR